MKLIEQIQQLYEAGEDYRTIGKKVGLSEESVRWRIRKSDFYKPKTSGNRKPTREKTIKPDGSMVIEETLSLKDVNDYDDIIEKLGLDSSLWDITSVRLSEWDVLGQENGEKLYSSKVGLKPKPRGKAFDLEQAISIINKIKPITVKKLDIDNTDNNLVIPMFDLHFGNSTFEDYTDALLRIKDIIEVKKPDKVLIICGGDILNEDNYSGQTSSGTNICKTDMTQAWADCFDFVSEIITSSESIANETNVMYVPGNHDTFSGHTVLLALERMFSKTGVNFNVSQEVFKAIMLDNVFIGCTHGHRANVKRYPMIMATTFPEHWGESLIRECFTGHLHNEWSSKDTDGIVVRQMPSRNKPDEWHKEMGYTASYKRFMLVEYSKNDILSINYV